MGLQLCCLRSSAAAAGGTDGKLEEMQTTGEVAGRNNSYIEDRTMSTCARSPQKLIDEGHTV